MNTRPDQHGLRLLGAALVGIALLWTASAGLRLARPRLRSDITPRHTNHRIDVNTADAATLSVLPGLGPGLAQRIVEHREEHGPFRDVASISAVKLIGPRTIERLRPWVVCVEPGDPADREHGTTH